MGNCDVCYPQNYAELSDCHSRAGGNPGNGGSEMTREILSFPRRRESDMKKINNLSTKVQ